MFKYNWNIAKLALYNNQSLYNAQDYSVLYNKAVPPIICVGWHFIHMWKALASIH